jgi:hypothetical protein
MSWFAFATRCLLSGVFFAAGLSKPRILWGLGNRTCGFDSHRPLHSQRAPVNLVAEVVSEGRC